MEYLPQFIKGLEITLEISAVSSFAALLIGVIIAFIRTTQHGPVKFLAVCYVELIRNTPLLIQMYIWYKGFPSLGLNLQPILCGMLALSIYSGAYISEVIRSGINSVAKEQKEAAKALGLNEIQAFRMIILPQAIRIIIPPLASQFINLVKNSSLVSFIAVSDIFYVIYKGAADDFRFFEFFIAGALIYMALTGLIALASNLLEHKLQIRGRMARI